jgi:hypothetical protein
MNLVDEATETTLARLSAQEDHLGGGRAAGMD